MGSHTHTTAAPLAATFFGLRGQRLADPTCAHPGDQGELARSA